MQKETIFDTHIRVNRLGYNKKLTKKEQLIEDCYKYDIFRAGFDNRHFSWFKETFGKDKYPVYVDELTPDFSKKLSSEVDLAKISEKWKEQRLVKGISERDIDRFPYFLNDITQVALEFMLKDAPEKHPHITEDGEWHEGIWDDYKKDVNQKKAGEKWKEILERMLFLLKEMNFFECSMLEKFDELTDKIEDLYDERANGELKDISEEKFEKMLNKAKKEAAAYEAKMDKYRENCRKEFIKLFNKYIWRAYSF